MTQIQVPFKYKVFENLREVEKIGYYVDELSHVFKICKGCLVLYRNVDNKSWCIDCQNRNLAGNYAEISTARQVTLKKVKMSENEFLSMSNKQKVNLMSAMQYAEEMEKIQAPAIKEMEDKSKKSESKKSKKPKKSKKSAE